MFNKTEKRALEEQREILKEFLENYGTVLDACQSFFHVYRSLDLYSMSIYAGNIHGLLKRTGETIRDITSLERIITGKYVECNKDSFNAFITDKTDYIIFNEFKKQRNGNIINTGKSYKKKFNLPRRDVPLLFQEAKSEK